MELPKRKKMRLQGFDYSSNGAYFVTICTYNRERILGDIDINVGQGLCSCRLFPMGRIIQDEIQKLNTIYENVVADKYCIMSDHNVPPYGSGDGGAYQQRGIILMNFVFKCPLDRTLIYGV